MIFLESQARLWLVVHAVLGAATVAVTTHLVVWIRRYPRGNFGRHRAARWFATTALALYATQFTVGNLLYPTYKIRVRAEYLDLATATRADVELRRDARDVVDKRAGVRSAAVEPGVAHERIARAFDVKEHWVALGLAVALAACLLAWIWNPARDGPEASTLFVSLAIAMATIAWLAAIVGLVVTSHRGVGSP